MRNVFTNTNENDRYPIIVPYRNIRLNEQIRNNYALYKHERVAPIMRKLRAIKSDIEVELTQ